MVRRPSAQQHRAIGACCAIVWLQGPTGRPRAKNMLDLQASMQAEPRSIVTPALPVSAPRPVNAASR